jgi:hypothetical protein
MQYFAKIENQTVTNVIVADQDFITAIGGTWVETLPGCKGGIHYGDNGQPDGTTALRKNYAGIGDTYDSVKDAFYKPKPSNLYQLNDTTCLWELNPIYTPLILVQVVSQVTTLPVGTPGKPIVIDNISLYDKNYALFASSAMTPQAGVYQYTMSTGILSYVDETSSTIITPSSNSTIYKYINNTWTMQSI